jgi:hypothetical protein
MSSVFEVWLDEERQIIRQRVVGEPDLAQFRKLADETEACANRLRCPTEVRILVDGESLGGMSRSVRAAGMDTLRRPELKRMAIITKHRMVRMMFRFMSLVTGEDKTRAFRDEADAIEWLLS